MKRVVVAAFAIVLFHSAQAAEGPVTGTESKSAELPLKRVILSTAGLAQFTHAGEVTPGTKVDLSVRLDQVDDLLKSLTIFDREGAIGAVSLPGKAPLAELFRDLPFGPEALTSPTALLNALVGAEVEIEGPATAKGRIFRVEEERVQLPNNAGSTVHHRLSLMTEKGLVQAVLEDLTALRFTEPLAKAQVERALVGLAQNRAKERRTLSIALLGQNKREAGFSYVVAAPVWKTAYRLVLPKENGKARLQGWGIVENLTGSDWKDVELSLISGNPVALKQRLYTAFYADRPEIPVTASARILPQRDEGGEARADKAGGSLAKQDMKQKQDKEMVLQRRALADGPMGQLRGFSRSGIGGDADVAEAAAPPPEQLGSAAVTAESEEAATQVLFRFPAKVSLASGSTMMVPFVDREIGASRTWLYQPETNARRPLAAVHLKNDGESALPAGLITAFDMSGEGAANFVGDAQLPLMPKGTSKFVTFALDSKTEVRRADQGIKQSRLGKAVNGELTLSIKSRWNVEYEIVAPADEDRDIVLDESRKDNWKLASDMKDVEETATRLRYKVSAPKGVTTKANLKLERLEHETVTLSSLEPEQLLATINGLENESPALKEAVAKLGGIVAEINKAGTRRTELGDEREKIGTDQERLRQNLNAVGKNTDLGHRYLDTLKEQEDRLAAIAESEKNIDKEQEARRQAAELVAKTLVLQ